MEEESGRPLLLYHSGYWVLSRRSPPGWGDSCQEFQRIRDYFLQLWCHFPSPVFARSAGLREGKVFSERPGANEAAEKKPGEWFFSLPCVSGDRIGQCHLWLREATTIPPHIHVKTGNPSRPFTSQ